jgi:hypothetical protein
MYVFGLMALLGLAVLGVSGIVNRYLSLASEAWAFMLVALGVGAAWLINLNLFTAWGIPVRNTAIAVTVTGLMIGGFGYFWREILGIFRGITRKVTDQAATIEKDGHLRRVS